MKKNLLTILLCTALCLLLPAAALGASDEPFARAEARWGSDYSESACIGWGTLQEAIDAAENDESISYVTLLQTVEDAAYTIAGGCFVLDSDDYAVTAAAGKSAFTVTGGKVEFDYVKLQGAEACICVDGETAHAVLNDNGTNQYNAADQKPAVILKKGVAEYEGASFRNQNHSCDFEYQGGRLDLTLADPRGLSVKNASGISMDIDSDAFRQAVALYDDCFLMDGNAKATRFENGKTYTVRGLVHYAYVADYPNAPAAIAGKMDELGELTVISCPDSFNRGDGWTFAGWYYYDENGEYQEAQPQDKIPLVKNTVFYALWEGMYAVYYEAADNSGSYEVRYYPDTRITLPECLFESANSKKFAGWRVYDNVLKQYVLKQPGDLVAIENGDCIQAVWQDEVVRITFLAADENADPCTVEVTDGRYMMPEPKPYEQGYVFMGWAGYDWLGAPLFLQPGDVFIVEGDAQFSPVWEKPEVQVNGKGMTTGDYMDNSGAVTAVKPQGGYAYYANGILTLNNFKGTTIESNAIDLTIVLEGSSRLESEEDVIDVDTADLTIQGAGTLALHGFDDEGIDVSYGNLYIKGGHISIESADHGIEADGNELGSSGGNIFISGGSLTIDSGDDGIDNEYDLLISGGLLNITAQDNGIDTSNGDVIISGGAITITAKDDEGIDADDGCIHIKDAELMISAGKNGFYAEQVKAENGVIRIEAENVAVKASQSVAVPEWNAEGTVGRCRYEGEYIYTLLGENGKPLKEWELRRADIRPHAAKLTSVSAALKEMYTLETLKDKMHQLLLMQNEKNLGNVAHFDVQPSYSTDGGKTWVPMDESEWPANKPVTLFIPYDELLPGGSLNGETHHFHAVHMFTQKGADHDVGDWEYPAVTEMEDGIFFTINGMSPVSVGWCEEADTPAAGGAEPPQTGDRIPLAALMMLLAVSAAGMFMLRRRCAK